MTLSLGRADINRYCKLNWFSTVPQSIEMKFIEL